MESVFFNSITRSDTCLDWALSIDSANVDLLAFYERRAFCPIVQLELYGYSESFLANESLRPHRVLMS